MNDVQFLASYNVSTYSLFPTNWSTTSSPYYSDWENSGICAEHWYANSGIYFLRYWFSWYDILLNDGTKNENEEYYAAIYNVNEGGTLNMTNLYIGIGAHFSVLYNGGSASIHGMHTQFSQNGFAYYDRWNLRLNTMITNNFGTLSISDSDIVGADSSLIDIYGGTVKLNNVTLAQSMMGITTYHSAASILMENINLYEIGKFYASLGAAKYHPWHTWNQWTFLIDVEPVYSTAPCHLSADSVTIENCRFSYLDSFGVLAISTLGLEDQGNDDLEMKSVRIINNEFAFNLYPDAQFDGYSYRSDFGALKSMANESFGSKVPVDDVADFISSAKWAANDSTGLIVVENGYEFVIGNNEIVGDAELRRNGSEYPVDPYLYIDSGSADGCIAGNILENIDIVVKSGNLKSCKHYGFDINQVESTHFNMLPLRSL